MTSNNLCGRMRSRCVGWVSCCNRDMAWLLVWVVTLVLYVIFFFNRNTWMSIYHGVVLKRGILFSAGEIRSKNKEKLILFYTAWFGSKPWPMGQPGYNYTQFCNCTFENCLITYDKAKLSSSDIVVFHSRDMPNYYILDWLNDLRPKGQLWMYFSMEGPHNNPDVRPIQRFFELSSTYRLNSNIHFPYRTHVRKPFSSMKNATTTITTTTTNYAKGKTRQIAWAVSNCGHQRDKLAKKLNQYGLQIDNFGKCKLPFTTSRRYVTFINEVPYRQYKFYFAAENQLCEDYVTEKYWAHGLANDAIPIVFGGANYSDPRLAIPGSFIDALSFSSPKMLAEYLLKVDKNDTLFNEYFTWKRDWTFYDSSHIYPCTTGGLFLCEICEKLHSNSWKVHKNHLSSVMSVSKDCKPKEEYFLSWINKP